MAREGALHVGQVVGKRVDPDRVWHRFLTGADADVSSASWTLGGAALGHATRGEESEFSTFARPCRKGIRARVRRRSPR